jgi:hypothetical protein
MYWNKDLSYLITIANYTTFKIISEKFQIHDYFIEV